MKCFLKSVCVRCVCVNMWVSERKETKSGDGENSDGPSSQGGNCISSFPFQITPC